MSTYVHMIFGLFFYNISTHKVGVNVCVDILDNSCVYPVPIQIDVQSSTKVLSMWIELSILLDIKEKFTPAFDIRVKMRKINLSRSK